MRALTLPQKDKIWSKFGAGSQVISSLSQAAAVSSSLKRISLSKVGSNYWNRISIALSCAPKILIESVQSRVIGFGLCTVRLPAWLTAVAKICCEHKFNSIKIEFCKMSPFDCQTLANKPLFSTWSQLPATHGRPFARLSHTGGHGKCFSNEWSMILVDVINVFVKFHSDAKTTPTHTHTYTFYAGHSICSSSSFSSPSAANVRHP